MGETTVTRIAKIAIPAILAIGAIFFAYSSFGNASKPEQDTKDDKAENKRENTSKCTTKPTSQCSTKPKLDLASASREDVVGLLAEVIQVQKQLGDLMDKVVERLLQGPYTNMTEVYQIVSESEPRDPLEAHGLTIQNFDALLDRFANDEEVHRMVVRVIQGPEASQADTNSKGTVLEPARIVEVNAAMRDRLVWAANEMRAQQKSLGTPYKSRTASLAAQAVVGAYVRREFGLTSDEVERSMIIHQFELSQSSDFLKINDEIQEIMQRFLTESE